jgi:ElaB/YqjD/DUF883 family membrane-anchored ribosome-binding protein
VPPPILEAAQAWDDEPGFAMPPTEQLAMEAHARRSLREIARNTPAAVTGFTVERGGRGGMAETAERIGTAVGTAQREVRRKLELVRRPAKRIEFPSTAAASAAAAELAEHSALMMQEIDVEAAEFRRQAAEKLEDWSEQTEQRLLHFRRQARTVLWRAGLRAQELAESHPWQTIAAFAGTFFLLGAALRLRRPRRG